MGDEYRRWCKQSNTTSSPPSSSSLTGMESFLWPMDIDNDTTKTSSSLRTDGYIHNPHMLMPLCPSSSSYPPLTTWNQPLLRGGGHQNFMKNQEEEEEKLYYGESEEEYNQSHGGLCCASEGVDCGQGENNINMNMMLPFFRKNDNYSSNCNINTSNTMDGGVVMSYPDFLRSPATASSSRQLQQQQQQQQLIISDVPPPVWNSGGVEGLVMSQTQILQGGMDLKSKDGRSKSRGVVYKRSGKEMGVGKRQRSEVGSGLPAFKVRKEKMGDRITTLQQLVSPFGKTDTASVLSESIEYIKFLHHQVFVLCAPYINSGEKPQHTKVIKDLRSKGLCMVPISSTFTMVNESSADFLTPTYGGTFR